MIAIETIDKLLDTLPGICNTLVGLIGYIQRHESESTPALWDAWLAEGHDRILRVVIECRDMADRRENPRAAKEGGEPSEDQSSADA